MQYFDAGRARRRHAHRGRPAAHRHRAPARTLHLQPLPGTDLALANGLLHIAIREGLVDEDYVADRTTGFDAVRAARRRVLARPGRADHRRRRSRDLRRDRAHRSATAPVGDDPHRPRRRAAQQRHRHRAGLHQPRAGPRPARPAVLRLRHDHRPGQRAGRPRARPEGRPAARLPQARRPGRPRARRRRSGGSTRTSCRRPGMSAFEMLDRLGTDGGVRALLVLASNIVGLRAGRQPGPRAGCARWTSWSSPTSSCPRPPSSPTSCCPTAQWAEEEGTMTNLEGRVHPPPAGPAAARRRARRPADAGRAGRPARPRPVLLATTRATVFDELRRASAGGIADYAGITYERIDAEQGVFWPCPAEDHPGTPRLFAERLPHRRRPGALHPGRAPRRRPRRPTASYPYVLTTGRLDAAVPERHPDPAGRRALQPVAAAARGRAAPRPGPAAAASRTATSSSCAPGAARAALPRRGHRRHPAGHRLRAVPLGRRVRANALTNPALDPHSQDAGVQGLRGRRARSAARRRPPARRPTSHTLRPHQPTRRSTTAPPSRRKDLPCSPEPFPARHLPLRRGRASTSPARSTPTLALHRARRGDQPRRCTSAAATPPTS